MKKIDYSYSVILGLISGKQARFNIHVQFRLQCGLINACVSANRNLLFLLRFGAARISALIYSMLQDGN